MSEYLEKDDVWVTQTRLPMSVRGFCKRGLYDIVVLNEDLNEEKKRKTATHEINHIHSGDLRDERKVSLIESLEQK